MNFEETRKEIQWLDAYASVKHQKKITQAPINKLHDLVDTLDYLNKHGLLGDDISDIRAAVDDLSTATEHTLVDLRYMAAKCDESVGVDGRWLIPHLQAIGAWGEDS